MKKNHMQKSANKFNMANGNIIQLRRTQTQALGNLENRDSRMYINYIFSAPSSLSFHSQLCAYFLVFYNINIRRAAKCKFPRLNLESKRQLGL